MLVSSTDSDRGVPRLCRLARGKRDDPYGFDFKTLRTEGRHVANNVKPDHPAYLAGLRDEDYILEVNGEAIAGMEHEAVVARISSNPRQVDLLVVADLAAYLRAHGLAAAAHSAPQHEEVDISLPDPQQSGGTGGITQHRILPVPGAKGLGISLVQGGRISQIDPGSPSDRAGLRAGDRIVQVNGQSVSGKSNKDIARLIKENEGNLVIGVQPGQSNEQLQQQQQSALQASPVRDNSNVGGGSPQLMSREAVTNLKVIVDEASRVQSAQPPTGSVSSATGKKISGKFISLSLSVSFGFIIGSWDFHGQWKIRVRVN